MKNFSKIVMAASLLAAMSMLPSRASAQAGTISNTGNLTVSANVQPSLNMVFDSDTTNGVALSSGAGSGSAALAFGNVVAYGSEPTNVTETSLGSSNFTVKTYFDVKVSEANSTSSSYSLTAELQNADSVNSWAVDGTAINNISASPVGSGSDSYDSDVEHNVAITIPISEASGAVSNIINFVATSK
jgi:hypothetical protein